MYETLQIIRNADYVNGLKVLKTMTRSKFGLGLVMTQRDCLSIFRTRCLRTTCKMMRINDENAGLER